MMRTVYVAKENEYEVSNILKGKCSTIVYERLSNNIDRISICGMESKYWFDTSIKLLKLNICSFIKRLSQR